MKGRTVLVAEDNEINMEIITELLQEYGIVVCQARNGKEAADLFIHSNPFAFDAVLLDMQMPVMDGCQAAKEIRTSGRKDAEEIPIIAITANAFPEDLAATTAAGMDAHVEKPIDIQLLCKTIEDLIKRNRGNRDAIV